LSEEVAAGRFREDLYYRLNVIQITLPALRERRGDIPLLVNHFLLKFSKELDRPVSSMSDAVMAKLMEHDFPGNVRELENLIERAVALSRGEHIGLDSLPPGLSRRSRSDAPHIPAEGMSLEQTLADYERALLSQALHQAGGVKKRAAQLLSVSFRSFRYRLEKLGLDNDSTES
jgi:two-component system response regulator PilR (NtrC family)